MEKNNEDAKKDLIVGALWCVGGIIATAGNNGYFLGELLCLADTNFYAA